MCNVNGNERVFDESKVLKDNAMLKVRPELFWEWDFDKNDELGLDIYTVTKGQRINVWWLCSKCKSDEFETVHKKVYGSICSYCSGRKTNHTNSLATLNPQLAKEWHILKNKNLTPHEVTCGNGTKVWWQCIKHSKHEWRAAINDRNDGRGCPFCNNKEILIGYNDMWTTNPEQAKLLADSEDGFKYTQASNKRANWKCSLCGETAIKVISKVNQRGFSCAACSDGISSPEKVIYNILKTKNVLFKKEMIFDWEKNKRYDFYLYDYNTIIETHGSQHKDGGFEKVGGRSLLEEQENDKYKKDMALRNKITNYIEIDASDTSLEVYKDKILQSGLNNIIDISDVSWEDVYLKSSKSILIEVCNYWNSIEQSVSAIAREFGINRSTVRDYLKRGSKINICEYTVEISISNSSLVPKRSIVQLTLSDEYIATWDSIAEAKRNNELKSASYISSCCKGKHKTAYGFKWMYVEDYESQYGKTVSVK